MSTSLLVAKEGQSGSPFGLGQKQAKKAQKIKKYGANAPQLHAIRYSIDCCVVRPLTGERVAWKGPLGERCEGRVACVKEWHSLGCEAH